MGGDEALFVVAVPDISFTEPEDPHTLLVGYFLDGGWKVWVGGEWVSGLDAEALVKEGIRQRLK